MPAIVGLTGGISTGKSTVSRVWKDAGVAVIDADEIARDVVRPGSAALRLIRWRFGPGVLQANGALDRAALGRFVFGSPAHLRRLNAITHPFIIAAMFRRLVVAAVLRMRTVIVLDTPLLFESGTLLPLCGSVVVVACTPEQQLERLLKRSDGGMSVQEARDRISSQMPLADKVARADYVLDNSREISEVAADAIQLLDKLAPSPAGEVCFRALIVGSVASFVLKLGRALFENGT
jgi:dephospho-CoA kinase